VDDLKPCRGYEVGYGKPPKNSQFAKGKSGNPKGRPKGSQNIATVLASVMREKVQLDENGRRRTTTKGKAVVLRVTNAALTGNLKAAEVLMVWNRLFEIPTVEEPLETADHEKERAVMRTLLKGIRSMAPTASTKLGGSDEPDDDR